jgi:hypothetical protein
MNSFIFFSKLKPHIFHFVPHRYRDTVEEAEARNGVIEGGTWEHRKRAR